MIKNFLRLLFPFIGWIFSLNRDKPYVFLTEHFIRPVTAFNLKRMAKCLGSPPRHLLFADVYWAVLTFFQKRGGLFSSSRMASSSVTLPANAAHTGKTGIRPGLLPPVLSSSFAYLFDRPSRLVSSCEKGNRLSDSKEPFHAFVNPAG